MVAPGGPYSGDLFVADTGASRIQIFDPATGAFIAAFGKEVLGSGPETAGQNICIAALGDICKAGVQSGSPNSYGFGEETGDRRPSSFAIDATGAIFVPGVGTRFLQKYSPDLASEEDFAPYICSPLASVLGCREVMVDPRTNDVYVTYGIPGEEEACSIFGCSLTTIAK